MLKPSIRPATAADVPALLPLLEQLGYPGCGDFAERRVRELVAHPDAALWVAQGEGGILGFISLHFVPQLACAGDFCRISYLCVAEHARGRGIGALLEVAAEHEARRRGCDRIELHSHERRTRAHEFYARQGYAESPKYLMKRL